MENKKILILEDDDFLLKVYKLKFTHEGFDWRVAKNGTAVTEILKTFQPDVVLTDLIMPDRDGFESIKDMRALENMKQVPIIVVSNLGQAEDKKKALEAGANEYIYKSEASIQQIVDCVVKYTK